MERIITLAQLEAIFLLLQQNKILKVEEKDIGKLIQDVLTTLDKTTEGL